MTLQIPLRTYPKQYANTRGASSPLLPLVGRSPGGRAVVHTTVKTNKRNDSSLLAYKFGLLIYQTDDTLSTIFSLREFVAMATVDIVSLVEEGKYEQLVETLGESDNGDKEGVKLNVNLRSKCGYSPLDMAALLGRRPLMELLLEHGADVNAANKSGMERYSTDQYGHDNCRMDCFGLGVGYTALHHTAVWGRLECLQLLLEKGACTSSRTRHQEDARGVAQRYGHLDCVHLIDCHGRCG